MTGVRIPQPSLLGWNSKGAAAGWNPQNQSHLLNAIGKVFGPLQSEMGDMISSYNGISTFMGYLILKQWYYLTHSQIDKRVHTFPKDTSLKVNIIVWLEFKLTYFKVAVQLKWRRCCGRVRIPINRFTSNSRSPLWYNEGGAAAILEPKNLGTPPIWPGSIQR